ncbi:hypothetical protein QFZ28_005183 [Neobacillus niacini]|nr:hypothetical protein [Neobacillus niacini]
MNNSKKSLWKALVNNGFLTSIFILLLGVIVFIYVLID